MNKKIKNQKYYTEEQKEIQKFIIIIIVLVLLIGAIYFLTDKFVEQGNSNNITTGEINYDKATIGTVLNRPYDEYYAIIYSSDSTEASYYNSIKTNYSSKDGGLKIYYIDLDNELNQKYYNVNNDNKSNPSAKSIDEINLGDVTLIKVKNGEIVSYIEDIEQIKTELK